MSNSRVLFLVEIIILLGSFLLLDHFVLAGDRLWDIHPHPFLFIIILAAVQYGTNEALLATLVASLALLVGNMPEQTLSQDVFDYLLVVSYRPLLWTASAVVFGGFRDRHLRERRDLQVRLTHAQKQADVFSTAYKSLDKERIRLETQLSGQSRTMLTLHQATKDMDQLREDQSLAGILDVVNNVMRSEKCSWFLLKDSKLVQQSQHGWDSEDHFSTEFIPETPLFQEVVGRQRVVCATSLEDEKIMSAEGVLAGPLINQETGEITGMIKIEQLEFTGLNLTSVETFKVLCEWLGSHFGTTTRYLQARSEMIQNPETQLYSSRYFDHISDFVSHLSNRIGFESSTIEIRPAAGVALEPELRAQAEEILRETADMLIRKTDLIFEGREGHFEFILILPNTPIKNAEIVSDKLYRALNNSLEQHISPSNFSFTIKSLGVKNAVDPTRQY
jgi:hypothetical protein